jgi:hypothetical protein
MREDPPFGRTPMREDNALGTANALATNRAVPVVLWVPCGFELISRCGPLSLSRPSP